MVQRLVSSVWPSLLLHHCAAAETNTCRSRMHLPSKSGASINHVRSHSIRVARLADARKNVELSETREVGRGTGSVLLFSRCCFCCQKSRAHRPSSRPSSPAGQRHTNSLSAIMATIQEVLDQVAALPTAPKPYVNPTQATAHSPSTSRNCLANTLVLQTPSDV